MKKILSVFLTIAMLLSFGAIFAFACDTDGCDTACDCVCATCDGVDCDCDCHPGDEPIDLSGLSGYELWKAKLTTGELGDFLQSLGQKLLGWGDWILKVLYYVCFGWLLTIDINISLR